MARRPEFPTESTFESDNCDKFKDSEPHSMSFHEIPSAMNWRSNLFFCFDISVNGDENSTEISSFCLLMNEQVDEAIRIERTLKFELLVVRKSRQFCGCDE